MEHGDIWVRAADWAGHPLDSSQLERLEGLRQWLITEAMVAGGIGPAEVDRIDRRHIADSLLFSSAFEEDPETMVDLGTGAGLPGLPLAIAMPETSFLLLDRSGKRIDLVKRAVRILELENVQVAQGEIEAMREGVEAIVSRATLPPDRARLEFSRLLAPGGVAVLGGSWTSRPAYPGWETRHVPPEILDQDVWLLIMRLP